MTKANGFSAPAHSPRLLAGQPRECSPSQECSNHSLIGHWPIPAACLTMWLTRCTTLEKRHPCCRFYNWDDTLEATWPLRPWPYRMVATWTLDLCSSRTRPAQCPVSGAQCPVSGSNLHVTDSAGMPSYHHNHQLALQLRERVNKCECCLQEIFYFWQKYSTFGRNILLLAEIFYFRQKYSTFSRNILLLAEIFYF